MKKRYEELDNEDLGRIIHEAHLALRICLNDSAEDVHWDALPESRKKMIVRRVELIRAGATPGQIQQDFIDWMVTEGWKPGPRDTISKTHPYILPYAALPPEEKAKTRQAVRIVFTHVMPDYLEEIAYSDLRSRPDEPEEMPVVCVTHVQFVPCAEEGRYCEYSEAAEDVQRVYEARYGK